jgi:glucose-6-phosphate isomerase
MIPDQGLTSEQLASIRPHLESIRDEMVCDEAQSPAFFRRPQEHLAAYATIREASELGRVFRAANGLHDRIDAVVVIACGSSYFGTHAFFRACCDPYHNELTRASRGSKPRMYFIGNHFDNDDTAALLSRLGEGGYNDTPVEKRWAIILIDPSGDTPETAAAFHQVVAALEIRLGDQASELLKDFVIPIVANSSSLDDEIARIECTETFRIAATEDERFNVLSPVGLLTVAMLGLDCMKLLAGARAINEHFKSAKFVDNVVLNFVATNHLLSKHHGKRVRVTNVWNPSLEAISQWYGQLVTSSLVSSSITPVTTAHTRYFGRRDQHHLLGEKDKVINHWYVSSCRQDTLTSKLPTNHPGASSATFLDIMSSAMQLARLELAAQGLPTTSLVLPRIDMFELGELFQMLMIATYVESRLV